METCSGAFPDEIHEGANPMRQQHRWRSGAIAFAFLLLSTSARAETTFIRAGAVVDPADARVESDVLIRVEDGKIADVSTNAPAPSGAEVIDLGDMYVLPGLIDCHTHLCSMVPVNGEAMEEFNRYMLEETLADRVLQSVANARDMLNAGFTTVRDVGNCGDWGDIAVRKAIADGIFEGPTPLVSGKIISPYGGQNIVNHEHMDLAETDYIFADSPDEMRKAVRQNLYYGADWIKIVVDGQKYIYTADDVRVIVEEAGRAGVRVCAHCMTDEAAKSAIGGGVASIEHGFMLSDDVLELMQEKGVWLVGTDFSKEVFEVYGYPQAHEMVVDRLRRAHNIGVPMAFGSDVVVEVPGHDRGSATLTLLDTWRAAGIPDGDILRAMTIDAARLLAIDDSHGAIRAGKTADIIAVPGNPLDDILALRDVAFVMKGGNVVKDASKRN
jgi:imidazolonepropionase-like amidohydrolase